MKKLVNALAVSLSLGFSTAALAEGQNAQFSTINGQNLPQASSVEGIRLSALHGKTANVKGLDLTLLAVSETDTMTGLQLPIIAGANHVNKSMKGVSFGLWNWNKGQATGLNIGAVNLTKDVKGGNIGFVNYSEGNTLVDFSAVNISKQSTVQLGFVNKTEKLDGLQLGFVNCADNGFLPCFVFFNFPKQ